MSTAWGKAGRITAKALGIKLQDKDPYDEVTRGESIVSNHTTSTFVEEPPHTVEFLREVIPSGRQLGDYALSLFPFTSWIGHYNLQWLLGDLVAGITIGAIVIPQGMAYAQLANLEPQFGLYSSFMGVLVYWFFATSKDITIGPVAVLSSLTGDIVANVMAELPNVPGHVIASALSILAGAVVLFIGLIRCGWIVDIISLTSLSAFMTGSALNIAVGQLPTLMGIKGFSTRDPAYLVFIHTLQGLPRTKLDAAMGLTALFMLYGIRSLCNYIAKRWPQHQRVAFFLSTLRTVFVILLYTMISWLANKDLPRGTSKFKILFDVPRGFRNAAVPVLDKTLASKLAGSLPATVIVLLIEHIAIAKSFGRINNYTIDPSQEMVAIGVTNMLGPFLGAYAATGSFSRTAVKSKAGVRTPFAGVITAIVVLLAIYALPAVFYYIPNAALAAVIIHAVGDLITPPNTVYQFWLVSPLEVIIFFVGVFVTIFSSIENGIYCTVCLSFAVLLFRILKAQGRFLGRVKVHSVLGDHVIGDDPRKPVDGGYGTFAGSGSSDAPYRNIFLPLTHADGSNPEIELDNPYPGIFIYRFSEGFNYPNASHTLEYMVRYIHQNTRRTTLSHFDRPGDRPWNDPGPSRRKLKAATRAGIDSNEVGVNLQLPTLKAIILDFSSVNNIDITSVQQLIDVRNQLDRYASPDVVDWHVACISNRWTKRALVSAGFGYPSTLPDGQIRRWKSIFSVAEIGGEQSAAATAEQEVNEKEFGPTLSSRGRAAQQHQRGSSMDIESGSNTDDAEAAGNLKATASGSERIPAAAAAAARSRFGGGRTVAVHGINRPLFHVDLTSALQSAIANVEARAEFTAATKSSIKGMEHLAGPTPTSQSQENFQGGNTSDGSVTTNLKPTPGASLPPYDMVDPQKEGSSSA
ncbi:sulfate permease [Neurospora crassa]|uniref:Sulfate permease II n=1 Tax=Neurospora crassa (strain ATCC 24698 / 74-OR23-1A / CBS 708.71 / DSM 1257 / FGSC 987) TaxID=367110 RepID=Q7SGT5_NEUCR|nr:sulfate permease II [Neurospora crassa OR74A]EAA36099.1 sulfate permease II [Neurospora crassa OR74A]KHE82983.1 sulfate permease [Neurospora crassa]|eukprot:XP_965335.1 sulfate permease II [Neurospora crassa OR74A]